MKKMIDIDSERNAIYEWTGTHIKEYNRDEDCNIQECEPDIYKQLYMIMKSGKIYSKARFIDQYFGGELNPGLRQALVSSKSEDEFLQSALGESIKSSKMKLTEADTDPATMVKHYLMAALWTGTDDNDVSLDKNYSIEDVADESFQASQRDCEKFVLAMERAKIMDAYLDSYPDQRSAWEQLGHDFWLTRTGEGSGFFARSELDDTLRKKLTKLADTFNEVYIYVGDDNKLYIQ